MIRTAVYGIFLPDWTLDQVSGTQNSSPAERRSLGARFSGAWRACGSSARTFELWEGPANAVVREIIGEKNSAVGVRIELSGAKCGADSGVAAADDSDLHDFPSLFTWEQRRARNTSFLRFPGLAFSPIGVRPLAEQALLLRIHPTVRFRARRTSVTALPHLRGNSFLL